MHWPLEKQMMQLPARSPQFSVGRLRAVHKNGLHAGAKCPELSIVPSYHDHNSYIQIRSFRRCHWCCWKRRALGHCIGSIGRFVPEFHLPIPNRVCSLPELFLHGFWCVSITAAMQNYQCSHMSSNVKIHLPMRKAGK